MNQNSKVIVRIEYEEGELHKICYGEIEEKNYKKFAMEKKKENFYSLDPMSIFNIFIRN